MTSLGVATAIQIISNLENTSKKKNSALQQLFERSEEDESEDDNDDYEDVEQYDDAVHLDLEVVGSYNGDEASATDSGNHIGPHQVPLSVASISTTTQTVDPELRSNGEISENLSGANAPQVNGDTNLEPLQTHSTASLSTTPRRNLRMMGGRMGPGKRMGRGRGTGALNGEEGSVVLPPAVLAQFEGLLPSEKLTINCIMQVTI